MSLSGEISIGRKDKISVLSYVFNQRKSNITNVLIIKMQCSNDSSGNKTDNQQLHNAKVHISAVVWMK